ncbi:MAG: hypothetical protein LBH29_01115 [Elusimicrobiota bacterium]|jgi:hypothetical protein|nr:hypothetical protein [Elusimicrobiota bacterium]
MEDEKKEEGLGGRMQNIGGKGFVSRAFQQISRQDEEKKAEQPVKEYPSAPQKPIEIKKEINPEIKKEERTEEKKEEKIEIKKQEKAEINTEVKKAEQVSLPQGQAPAQKDIQMPFKSSALKEEFKQELSIESAVSTLYSKILYKVKPKPLSRKELSAALGQKNISGQLNQIILKLLNSSLIEHTIPSVPNHPKQQFRISKKGLAFLDILESNAKKAGQEQ